MGKIKTSIPQCFINEESLDYLLFKKLPMNVYSKKFTKSTNLNRQPNSCVAWKVQSQFKIFSYSKKVSQTNTYKSNLVDLAPFARLFPQTNIDSCTMVHLWPKVSNPFKRD